uniref:A kinase (PRKA) anchor protein 9 n=1 Tax=Oryzias latipes TaxID=8090 RepID=A0A3B3IJ68_ORYLA
MQKDQELQKELLSSSEEEVDQYERRLGELMDLLSQMTRRRTSVIGQFQEKIDQMQELHAAEILDMEARHIAESENLRRDLQALEAECKALKAVIDELLCRKTCSWVSVPFLNVCLPADSSSDYSQRTGLGLLQQELRTTPEGAGREAEDPLPDRIKSLIREVHQEGMQVLSLSELPLSEGQAARHGGVPGWQKERDAVLATLESFKAVVAQAQVREPLLRVQRLFPADDWRADLLDAVRQVFERQRSVLKSAWFSQLGLLDTSDAVVHLNQLELRLDEQVTRRTRTPLLRTCWFTLEKPEMVMLGSVRVILGSVRVMLGSVRVMLGSVRVILGSLRVILGSARVILGMFCSCGPSEPDPYVGEGRFWSPPVPHRLSAEVDADELSWIQSNVDEVVVLLQRTPGLPSFPENPSLLAAGTSSSSNSLTERLLRQNAELTGFVSRLTEEKNDLRNRTLRLEEELRRYRQAGLGPGFGVSSWRFWENPQKAEPSGSVLSQEREVWAQEKIRLEKALLLAQAQNSRLRGEIRSNAVQEITGPEADSAALKRMYGRYLRAESFRKALVYQKKYLLLLLGGFQECEEATLFLLTRMGGRPALEPLSKRRQGLTRFRSAARVAIALSRMRFLVKRWHQVRESSFLHPAAADLHRERGGGEGVSGGRGRSGSPRSGASSSHPRLHAASDPAALTCSHLQGYDPDRALTDYISRLEALQRRLGSVASGEATHCGLRR